MSYSNAVYSTGPSGYWRFNEFRGDYTFDEINGIPLTYEAIGGGILSQQQPGLINDPNFSINVLNYHADGIVPHDNSGPGSFAIWFKTTTVVSDQATLLTNYRNDDDWSFRLKTINLGGQITLELHTTQGLISIPAVGIDFNDGQTYFVVMTYDGSNILLYVNSVLVGFRSSISIIDSITDYFAIANEYEGTLETQYNGFIDEAAFYNYALPQSAVLMLYNAGLLPPTIPTVGGLFASLIDVQSFVVNPKL